MSSASVREAGDEVRYGISTHSSRSAPIASVTRYATSAESIPPDSPTSARSKPAWRSWPRMNSPMTRRATSVSIASSVGSSNVALGHGRTRRDRRRDVEPGLGALLGRRIGGQAGPLGDDPVELADLELGPLVAQQRQRDPRPPDLGEVDIDAGTGPRRRAAR